MNKKLIVAALLTAFSLPVSAEVFKCTVDGKTVYQQTSCAGQVDTVQPMKISTKDTGAGGIRESELEVSKSLSAVIDSASTDREELRQAQSTAEIKRREMVTERRKAAAQASMAAAMWLRNR